MKMSFFVKNNTAQKQKFITIPVSFDIGIYRYQNDSENNFDTSFGTITTWA